MKKQDSYNKGKSEHSMSGRIKSRWGNFSENAKEFWREYDIHTIAIASLGMVAVGTAVVAKDEMKHKDNVSDNLKNLVTMTVDTTALSSKVVSDYKSAVKDYAEDGNIDSHGRLVFHTLGFSVVKNSSADYDKINEKIENLNSALLENKLTVTERSMQDTAVFYNGNERTLYISPDEIFDASRKEILEKAVNVVSKTPDSTVVFKK